MARNLQYTQSLLKEKNMEQIDRDKLEFVISQIYNISQGRLYQAWTDKELIQKWWAPQGCTTEVVAQEFAVNKLCLNKITTPNGEVFWDRIIYKQILRPTILQFICSFSNENGEIVPSPFIENWPLEILTTCNFMGLGKDETKFSLKWHPINASDKEIQAFIENYNIMNQGWSATLDQIEDIFAPKNSANENQEAL